ncbi:MAG TPA: cation-transporting P-type ATPase, partial [Chloroflexota bacterium]|nr:cation-transporting P-type ATPase [Chloroflexota bacterium]
FAACDIAIELSSGRSSWFPPRADLLAPDLGALSAIIEAGARREAATRDAVALSAVANVAGSVWGFRGQPGIERASLAVHITALAALADSWLRLRGGEQPRRLAAQLVDPRPERWGRRSVPDVLRALDTTEEGLTSIQAAERQHAVPPVVQRHALLRAVLDQIRSPLTGTLAAAAGLSLVLGSALDVAIITATIAVNVAVGAWQEHQAGRAAEALRRMATPTARVLRDGRPTTVPATDLVPGDVLLLAPGDRVAADARLLSAQGLEVDEAALTGESLPVPKAATGGTDASRVVLEGSDVTVGTGWAVVVAVGRHTRLGATAAALALEETQQSALGARLHHLMSQVMPLSAVAGALVAASGLVRGQPLLTQLAVGASLAIAALPEGLPLLAGTAQAAVARRLMHHHALVRRLDAVEALGRVDVACADKTGTLTEGRLALRVVADLEDEATLPLRLPADLQQVLLTAALASPHPDAVDVAAHPTDLAVAEAARAAGLVERLRAERTAESPFEPTQSFHAAVVRGRLRIKGAPEVLLSRCTRVRRGGHEQPLDETHRQALQARAQDLMERGLRVLMVADGPAEGSVDDPQELTALGFVGIHDPLRPGVPAAVRRCHDAGIRVIMLTGDHPATARAIAREAGLLAHEAQGGRRQADASAFRPRPSASVDAVLVATEIAELEESELDRRLEGATVIARATPLDKLRIVESLQRRGHTVAMTGDGVND